MLVCKETGLQTRTPEITPPVLTDLNMVGTIPYFSGVAVETGQCPVSTHLPLLYDVRLPSFPNGHKIHHPQNTSNPSFARQKDYKSPAKSADCKSGTSLNCCGKKEQYRTKIDTIILLHL